MNRDNSFQTRIDLLTLFFMDKHYDISAMSIEEYLSKFNEIGNEICDNAQKLSNNG